MTNKKIFFFLLLGALTCLTFHAQNRRKADSLLAILKTANDSVYTFRACELADELCELKEINTAFKYLDSARLRAVKSGKPRYKAYVYNNLGNTYVYLSDYTRALESFEKAAEQYKVINYLPGLASAILNTGNAYFYAGDNEKAEKAYNEALQIQLKCPKDISSLSNIYNNMGSICGVLGKYIEAESYLLKVVELNKQENDLISLAKTYNNLSSVCYGMKREKEGEEYLNMSFDLKMKYGTNADKADALHDRAIIYQDHNDYSRSIEYNKKAIQYLDTNVHNENLRRVYTSLANSYEFQKNFEMANYYRWKLSNINTEIAEEEVSRALLQNEMMATFRQNHLKDSLVQASYIQKQNAEIKQNNIIKISLIIIVITISIFSFLLYQRFKLSRSQNELITKQKQLVEEKQKEILSSIQYAQRIQRSLLPTEKFIERIFNKKKPS